MAIEYDRLIQAGTPETRAHYDTRDTILYALGIGFGQDPLAENELSYVCEERLQAVPTMSSSMCWTNGGLVSNIGLDFANVLHGEQRSTLHRPLPPSAEISISEHVTDAIDKGPDKGALVLIEKRIKLAESGEPLATIMTTIMARGDGGFGGPTAGAPEPHRLPERPADKTVSCATRTEQALLFAQSGDRNPLHRDPVIARAAGFKQPILHGLATYGIACRALLTGMLDHDASRIAAFDARFSTPVYPGETIATEIWADGETMSFRCKAVERDVIVLNNGRCALRVADPADPLEGKK